MPGNCKKKRCLLKGTSPQDLKKFRWSNLMKEYKREAPVSYKVLRAIATPSQLSLRKLQLLTPVTGSAGAMLLKFQVANRLNIFYNPV